jgi:UDPglucose 6-dehydrogenase
MKITVIGTGYVGLVTGACLAEMGNHVLCLDLSEEKITALKNGHIPIYEPGLEEIVIRNAAAGRLEFTTDIPASVRHGTIQFIAVGTPPGEDGSADLSYVLSAARNIGRLMTDYKLVIDKSTVPVGTAALVKEALGDELKKRNLNSEFSVASNPEFVKSALSPVCQ